MRPLHIVLLVWLGLLLIAGPEGPRANASEWAETDHADAWDEMDDDETDDDETDDDEEGEEGEDDDSAEYEDEEVLACQCRGGGHVYALPVALLGLGLGRRLRRRAETGLVRGSNVRSVCR